jgi:hypothetical protein
MVRFVVSQWLEPPTLGSELVKVTSQDTAVLVVTVKVVLFVVSVLSAADVAFVSVLWYACPLTSEPAAQLAPVKSWMVSVPFSGAPAVAVMLAVSLGTQVWAEAADVVSVTVKHSPEVASPDPV